MKNRNKKLLLIDANSFIHRSFHALPPLTNDEGQPTGALYGLANTLLKILREERPDYVAAAFDTPEDTFRKEMFEEYKAHRPEAPDELIAQIKESQNLLESFGIKTLKKEGYEADDVIGTLVEKLQDTEDLNTVILTGDLDTLQLVRDHDVVVLTPKRSVSEMKTYDTEAIEGRFGIGPSQLPDYKGLVGDSSDNIPGVPGIGKKTAEKILKEYGSLEKAIEEIKEENDLGHRVKKLAENQEQAKLSKKLGTIKKDVPLDIDIEGLAYKHKENESLQNYFKKMDFSTLLERVRAENDGTNLDEEKLKDVLFVASKDDLEEINKSELQSNKTKVAYDWKSILKQADFSIEEISPPLFDVQIASWLLNPDNKNAELESIAEDFLGKEQKLFDDSKDKQKSLEKLYIKLSRRIKEENLKKVFHEIEMPLIKVLVRMEERGIRVNENQLEKISAQTEEKIKAIENEIYEIAGEEFNLNSPKQIGKILFEKLGIEDQGKTSTGQYKTSEEILSKLSKDYKIAELILEYREFYKIRSTYIEPFLEAAKGDNEIHTTFLQSATSTGRLASESPNMQNIPKGSTWATKLRRAFVAREEYSLLSFDYSQLELRVLAHVSGDESMKKAFKENKDIHKLTASKIMDRNIEDVSNKERELAKTLNFGVVFGMGPKAFSQTSGLSLEESKEFIDKYFEDFSGVKEWHKQIKKQAESKGVIRNENGRLRRIKGGGYMERAAINMPIQSLGADIIKMAMIKTDNFIQSQGLTEEVGLLLSIHDELLLEVSDDNLESVKEEVENILENKAYSLSVPLKVDEKTGKNWGEMRP